MNDTSHRIIYTIGHSNLAVDRFLELLHENGIETLMDVRSRPVSRHVPQFNKARLEKTMSEAGITYVWLGKELGGLPDEEEFYDADGFVLYNRLASTLRFKEGFLQLLALSKRSRCAIMCVEEDPSGCHRRLLIGRALIQKGKTLAHIRKDGSLIYEPDPSGASSLKPALLDITEEQNWKSVKPMPKKVKKSVRSRG
ncbi:MAG: DUF488 domain-containing protein [Deltaproteobacteria bacterium]|nr:DUF488 domain-containing protein [Deltaproteobacteria bacterium]